MAKARTALIGALALAAVVALVVLPSEDFGHWYHDWRNTSSLDGDLHALAGPVGARSHAATVALGDGRVLIWGGQAMSADSGAVYTPGSDSWESLPAAPGKGRASAAAVWTGQEAVILGGWVNTDPLPTDDTITIDPDAELDAGGIAWNPITRRWRSLPDAPVALIHARAVAFEQGILVMGRPNRTPGDPISLWLAVGSHRWTKVPTPVTVVNTAWLGNQLVVTGPQADPAESTGAATRWSILAFDPVALSWTPVADAMETEWMALAVAPDGTLTAVSRSGLNEPLRGYVWSERGWTQVARTYRGDDTMSFLGVMAYPPVTVWAGDTLLLGGQDGLTSWDPAERRFATRQDGRLTVFGGTAVWNGASLVSPADQNGEGWVWTPR